MIQLLLLGNVDLLSDSGASLDAHLRQSKRIAVLAYLITARPVGFHRRDKIAALFWPELSTERARAALRTTLTRLRDDHGAELIVSRGADEIAIDLAQLRCDTLEFDAAIASSRFGDAIALYRGPFLDGVHVEGAGEELEDWISIERARLRDELLRALGALGEAAERRGDVEAAVAAARRALDVSPNDEILARRAISLLVASGNRGGAMQEYDRFVQRLHADLGVDPAPETEALVAPLRTRGIFAAVARSRRTPESSPKSAGEQPAGLAAPVHRATGLSRAFSLFRNALAVIGLFAVAQWVVTMNRAAAPTVEVAAVWQPVNTVTRPAPALFGARAVLDSTNDALLVLGGIQSHVPRVFPSFGASYWRLRGLSRGDRATWTQLKTAPGAQPSPRWLFGASSDAAHDRVVVHGGALGSSSPCANDTWILDHASGLAGTPSWRLVQLQGPSPPARMSFDQVFDAKRRRLIVFGGNDCVYPRTHETWVLAFDDSTLMRGRWSLLVPDSTAGLPFHRDSYAAAYDTVASRLFVYGGRAETVATGELWALDHASGMGGTPAWRPIVCDGDHPVRLSPATVMDFATDTWTIFGGQDERGMFTRLIWRVHGLLRDVNHCRWEQLAQAEPSPPARTTGSAAMLPGSRGIVIFGGEFRDTPLADAWILKPGRP